MLHEIELLAFEMLPPLYVYLKHEAVAARFPGKFNVDTEAYRSKTLSLRSSMLELHSKVKDYGSFSDQSSLNGLYVSYCYDLLEWYDCIFDLCNSLSALGTEPYLQELSLKRCGRKSWPHRHMIDGTDIAQICGRQRLVCSEVLKDRGALQFAGFTVGTAFDVYCRSPNPGSFTSSRRSKLELPRNMTVDTAAGRSVKHSLKESAYIVYALSAYLLAHFSNNLRVDLALYDGLDDLGFVGILDDVELIMGGPGKGFSNMLFAPDHVGSKIMVAPRKRPPGGSREELAAFKSTLVGSEFQALYARSTPFLDKRLLRR